MRWEAVLLGCVVAHVVGDFLLQTEWQASTKTRGFADADGRRALISHVVTYTAAFAPVRVTVTPARSRTRTIVLAAMIALPHLILDDGRFVRGWLREVKHCPDPDATLALCVDQSMHLVCLVAAAVAATA